MGGCERYPRDKPHCKFEEVADSGKTKIWAILSVHTGIELGEIRWWGAWHKYVAQYHEGTMMDKGCHKEVDDFIDEQMKKRREARRKQK